MGNSASALPYKIGEEIHPSTRKKSYGFSIHSGEQKSDKKPVTVFKGEKSIMAKTALIKGGNSNDPSLTQIFPALHHFKKCKTLIHPHILKVYATLDTDYPDGNDPSSKGLLSIAEANPASLSTLQQTPTTGDLIIVTEPVVPLEDYLNMLENDPEMTDAQRADAVAWGIYTLILAVNFLHVNAKVAHGNLIPEAIFVTPAGDFKLSAFHILTPIGIADGATGPTQHFRHFERDVTTNDFRSPERIEGRFDAISTSPVHAMDAYSFGVLLPEIYRHYGTGTSAQLPQKLEKACLRLRTPSVTSRPRILPLSKCPIFTSPHIQAQKFMDEIATQPIEDKISFWKSLPDLFSQRVLSSRVAKHKILPLLQLTITNLTTTDLGLTQEISKRECLALLPTLFKMGKTYLTKEEFQPQLSAIIELLFKVNDRGVRGAMLGRIALFAELLDQPTLNRVVFEPMCSGFTDSSAPLRELTLKSAIILVAYLTQPNLEKLTRYLVRMQSDPEDSIRTNTVIFIGKVAPNLSAMARSKLILPAFMRAMKDGFIPCRLAGLKAVCACRLLFDEKRLASDVLPAISPSLVDGSSEVRDAAMRAVDELLVMLREFGEKMRVEEAKQPKILHTASNPSLAGSVNGSSSVNASGVAPAPSSATSSSYMSGISSWASSRLTTTSTKSGRPTASTVRSELPVSSIGSGTGMKSQPAVSSAPSVSKTLPAFSSLNLRDAGIGGASTGWSDDEFEQPRQQTSIGTKKSLIPAFATDMDDNFMSQFDRKTAIRPRTGGASKLQTSVKITAGARRREELSKARKVAEKKEKPGIMKLNLDEDPIDDGWDDF
jgi:SCY1-like protein 1